MCGFYMPTHTDTLYICMPSQSAPPPSVHAHGQTRTLHSHTCANMAMHAHSYMQTEGMHHQSVSQHAGDDCLRKRFAFGLTLLMHFRKLKLKYPQKVGCTER